MSATRRHDKLNVSVHFVESFGKQLLLPARRAHDKMAVLPGAVLRGLTGMVRTVAIGAWDRR